MITRRDLMVATIAITAVLCVLALGQEKSQVLGSTIFAWNPTAARKTDAGSTWSIVRSPTSTLRELEIHVTRLDPGKAPHPPHKHVNEEMIIIKEGTLDAYVNGEWKKAGPGDVLFFASNQLHGVRNAGSGPATYHVINWNSGTK